LKSFDGVALSQAVKNALPRLPGLASAVAQPTDVEFIIPIPLPGTPTAIAGLSAIVAPVLVMTALPTPRDQTE